MSRWMLEEVLYDYCSELAICTFDCLCCVCIVYYVLHVSYHCGLWHLRSCIREKVVRVFGVESGYVLMVVVLSIWMFSSGLVL